MHVVPSVQKIIGDGHSEDRIVGKRGARVKKREVRPLIIMKLINRADDIARNRPDHDTLGRCYLIYLPR